MKTFKIILRILVVLNTMPLFIMVIAPENFKLVGYITGWKANLIISGVGLMMFFLWWLFKDDYKDYDSY